MLLLPQGRKKKKAMNEKQQIAHSPYHNHTIINFEHVGSLVVLLMEDSECGVATHLPSGPTTYSVVP